MTISNFDLRMFNAARLEAEKSDYKHFHIGCVIAYKHAIIGRGHNSYKTHPAQKVYNRQYRKFNNQRGTDVCDSIHAEMAAIKSVSYTTGIQVDWSKVKMYVYRISGGKKYGYGCSRPCPACMHAIKDLGIRHLYHTDDDGLAYIRLND